MKDRVLYLVSVCGFVTVLTGCTTSPAQPAASVTPVVTTPSGVVNAPTAVTPLSGSSSLGWPTFTVTNATRSGTSGPISYRFEVSTSSTFGTSVVAATVPEGPGQTSFTPALNQIPPNQTGLFWRVIAFDTGSIATSSPSTVQNVTIDFPDQVRIAAQQGRALWAGTQPPAGAYGRARLGTNWEVLVRNYPRGTFLSPPFEALQLIDLIDRGMNPGDAIVWQGSHGYSTAQALYYPDISGGVIGYDSVYLSLDGGLWNLTVRTE